MNEWKYIAKGIAVSFGALILWGFAIWGFVTALGSL